MAVRDNFPDGSFQQELNQLIAEAMAAASASPGAVISSRTQSASSSITGDGVSAGSKREWSSDTSSISTLDGVKRSKVEVTSSEHNVTDLSVHPQRRALVAQETLISPASPPREPSHTRSSFATRANGTNANAVPVGKQPQVAQPQVLAPTHPKAIRRQWNPEDSDVPYEDLLKHRRQEKLDNIDRYVPAWDPKKARPASKRSHFPFARLPVNVRSRIMECALVSPGPIAIDFTWLRPFVRGHARLLSVSEALKTDEGVIYRVPVPWKQLQRDVGSMKSDMEQFKAALEVRGDKKKGQRSPARNLTTSLLRVSREVHALAQGIFYGQNTFNFCSFAPAAWQQLESFLLTIGTRNASLIRSIQIAAPMFHRGIEEDYIEGAILDIMAPATRFATPRPVARDRLLSAISVSLPKLHSLNALAIDLAHPQTAMDWTGQYINDKRLISLINAEEHIRRKIEGTVLLKQMSDGLAAKGARPVMTITHFTKASAADKREFRSRLAGLIKEADKYGWTVNQLLQDPR